MKIVIFAGGVGTRLWPMSRKNTPKQFEKIIGDKSTLQLTVERLLPDFPYTSICIATGIRYKDTVLKQLPEIPKENFIFEPEMRDVGPAIGLAATILAKQSPFEPVAILWSDHLVKNEDAFKHALLVSQNLIEAKKSDFVFIGQKPRFANQNIGWIEVGENITDDLNTETISLFHFKQLRYRPQLSEAKEFFTKKNFVWNLGYFVTTPHFLLSLFQQHVNETYKKLLVIGNSYGTDAFSKTLEEVYPTIEKITFDDSILDKLDSEKISVISSDIGWSDVGAWEGLKEALSQTEEENVTHGKIMLENSRDTLFYNYTDQLVVGIDLDGMLVINSPDVLLICPKNSVPKIKKLVEGLAGTEHENLT